MAHTAKNKNVIKKSSNSADMPKPLRLESTVGLIRERSVVHGLDVIGSQLLKIESEVSPT